MKITFLGGGNMANALIGGLIRQGFPPDDLCAVEPQAENRDRLSRAYGIRCHAGPAAEAWAGDLIVLAVKPQQMKAALPPLAPFLDRQVVLSIAAGLGLETLSRWLGGYRKLVRAMPNTPALIGAGLAGLVALPEVGAEERQAAEKVLNAVGTALWVTDEARMDGITAVSGSGPAYVFLFIEALEQGAREQGFSPQEARRLSLETLLGAARLAAQSEEPAARLREQVTSPGGTTEAALKRMEAASVKAGIIAGIHAAADRSRELGRLLGEN